MKLEHEVVRDLYPLYMENELSPAVKQAVDAHLSECEACRNTYQTGEEFFDHIKELENTEVPNTVDERVRMKIRLTRYKWITAVLTAIILTLLVSDYKSGREKLILEFENYYRSQELLPIMFNIVKEPEHSELEYVSRAVNQLFVDMIALEEHLNFFEKHQLNNTEYYLSINTSNFNSMLEIMQFRFEQGMWSDTDEAAYQVTQQYFDELNQLSNRQYRKFKHGFSSYFETLDVEEFDRFYKDINNLSDSYTRFHKLPEELQPMDEKELAKHVAHILDVHEKKVELRKESPLNDSPYTYQFHIDGQYDGAIDGITGQLLEVRSYPTELGGPTLAKDETEEKVKGHVEKIYGSNFTYDLVPIGGNASNESKYYKLYSFKIIPNYKGYPLYTPLEQDTVMTVNARTGEIDTFRHNQDVPSYKDIEKQDLEIAVPLETFNKQGLSKTVVIYSAITGKFELVHMNPALDYFEKGKFYSAKTGKEEWIRVDGR
ncbi:putative 3-demethylubiquinone-9 3-methyltransferase (glyoxalase superfamily) [Bacillus tianshenii]|uniref:Anti-sigma-W factor RsiW n=1 Tax=Sutcliffiella tianshenii TaxID=1463404 RepID=A0ABS2P2E9_9BACI|nr:zf-HC2 domain-containing protein [Bacillus tianshenii]MBM7621136.1 putative 3-demethylubiquinone-9 3-methyltransferase (glyoxalase superfamily) [Bacillus tianshenii]